ncbi:PRC-barrel domain-containing protein [Microvirga arabica]|uniref:PRC-barrel domain-containing protein n=1 Tax=Microvirga arabica TaxID=1128671 RepID=UPI00193A8C59|nr:PRC-barrel domain-containing protein [Microvirga arabica]MBM1170015.1 PRC-barrel domain-containing protein [Microvirga arabica]
MMLSRIQLPLLMAAIVASPVLAQQQNPAVQPRLEGQVSQLSPDLLYTGWRAQQLLGQPVMRKGGNRIGTVRDLIIDADGRLAAMVMEGGGALGIPDAVYRIPWDEVDLTPGQDGVSTGLANNSEKPQYGLFPGTEGVPTAPREFRLTEVLGDYARLQTGYGYGYVSDAVFDKSGRLIAVLIARDVASGGGTYAFPYPGTTGRWDPAAGYYGLPFVMDSQAQMAGLRVDPTKFKGAAL